MVIIQQSPTASNIVNHVNQNANLLTPLAGNDRLFFLVLFADDTTDINTGAGDPPVSLVNPRWNGQSFTLVAERKNTTEGGTSQRAVQLWGMREAQVQTALAGSGGWSLSINLTSANINSAGFFWTSFTVENASQSDWGQTVGAYETINSTFRTATLNGVNNGLGLLFWAHPIGSLTPSITSGTLLFNDSSSALSVVGAYSALTNGVSTDITASYSTAGSGAWLGIALPSSSFVEDKIPDSFTVVDQSGVPLSTLIESAEVTPSGFNTQTQIEVDSGEFSVYDPNTTTWDSYSNTTRTIKPAGKFKVRITSSATNNTATNVVVKLNGDAVNSGDHVSDTWTITTVAVGLPTITSITSGGVPNTAQLGSKIILTLSSSVGVTAITYGGVDLSGFAIDNGTQVSADVPYSGKLINSIVAVGFKVGATSSSTQNVTVVPPAGFSYVNLLAYANLDVYSPFKVEAGFEGIVNNTQLVYESTSSGYTTNFSTTGLLTIYSAPVANYDIDYFFIDPTDNQASTIETLTLSAGGDITPPNFSPAPAAENVTQTSIDVRFGSTEDGEYAVVVKQTGSPAPLDNEYIYTSTLANTVIVVSKTGLVANTGYTIYVRIRDIYSNTNQATVAVTTAQTPDSTPDTIPNQTKTNVSRSVSLSFDTITVSGINTTTIISVSGGEYRIGAGSWTTASGIITNGQTVDVRHTTSSNYLTNTITTLTIGGVSTTFTSQTLAEPLDTEPDPFVFAISPITNADILTVYESDVIVVTGINTTVSATSTVEYSKNNGAWQPAGSFTVVATDTLKIRLTSSDNYNTSVTGYLTIQSHTASLVVITKQLDLDVVPNPFTFTAQTSVDRSTVVYAYSNTVTISGINTGANIAIGGDVSSEYQINGGVWSKLPSTIFDGQTLRVRHITSPINNTVTTTTISIEGSVTTFTSTTKTVSEEPTIGTVQLTVNSRIPY